METDGDQGWAATGTLPYQVQVTGYRYTVPGTSTWYRVLSENPIMRIIQSLVPDSCTSGYGIRYPGMLLGCCAEVLLTPPRTAMLLSELRAGRLVI